MNPSPPRDGKLLARKKYGEDEDQQFEKESSSSARTPRTTDEADLLEVESAGTLQHSKAKTTLGSARFHDTPTDAKSIKRSKVIVYSVIVLTAVLMGTITYFALAKQETNEYLNAFTSLANSFVASAQNKASNLFLATDSLATDISALALESDAKWPFFTVPHFELRGQKILGLSSTVHIYFAPLIKSSNLLQWEQFTVDTIKTSDVSERNDHVWRYENGSAVSQSFDPGAIGDGNMAPVWQQVPQGHSSIINFDMLSDTSFESVYRSMWEKKQPVISEPVDDTFFDDLPTDWRRSSFEPNSLILQPVFLNASTPWDQEEDSNVPVALLVFVVNWANFFSNVLSGASPPVYVSVDAAACGTHMRYKISGANATYIDNQDFFHDASLSTSFQTKLTPLLEHSSSDREDLHCKYSCTISPSLEMQSKYKSNKPYLYALAVVLGFVLIALVFMIYMSDFERRQKKVSQQTNEVVRSTFAPTTGQRILPEVDGKIDVNMYGGDRTRLKEYLDSGHLTDTPLLQESNPIAELFPSVTTMFADIAGFTAWSSVREPTQVFILLESIFSAFDNLARRHRVFKVETVGDCYVAVAGLPEPRRDHAVVMARFAQECIASMNHVVKMLEVDLGPDTGDLAIRIGLHSGPVVAGVLRGDKARFQLFGDVMNTTARIETTGERNKIHVSADTANLLAAAGKSHWLTERCERVEAKGKGQLKTFWVDAKDEPTQDGFSGTMLEETTEPKPALVFDNPSAKTEMKEEEKAAFDRKQRLISWNVDVLTRKLKKIAAKRMANQAGIPNPTNNSFRGEDIEGLFSVDSTDVVMDDKRTIDEVEDVVYLPPFDAQNVPPTQEQLNKINLGEKVVTQLHDFVSTIASLYRDNPFHNFEHASHVVMSVVKLLGRLVAPEPSKDMKALSNQSEMLAGLHDLTYGIKSDPLTLFACVFVALIHDIDHSGVPNFVLVEEKQSLAMFYQNKAVAEQNSVDIAWKLLMGNEYKDLRAAIYSNNSELKRFRQLVVNLVMATDIMDRELKAMRNARWGRAFEESTLAAHEEHLVHTNRMATIVLEHLIQASDVAHTMQHWHVFIKWNERLFQEKYRAFQAGRLEDPSELWYEREIGFFDFYVIPLAKKLKECRVFGVSSDEYLNYAISNRSEWEQKGKQMVSEMLAKIHAKHE